MFKGVPKKQIPEPCQPACEIKESESTKDIFSIFYSCYILVAVLVFTFFEKNDSLSISFFVFPFSRNPFPQKYVFP